MTGMEELQIFFGALPPLLPRLGQYLDQGRCVKVFKNEKLRDAQLATDHGRSLVFVQKGRIKLCMKRIDGSILNFIFCGPDTVIGQTEDSPYTSLCDRPEMIACENSVVYYFDQERLYSLFCQDKELFLAFLQLNFTYCTLFNQRTVMTSCLDADQRILGWLDRLCKGAEPKPGGSLFIPCSMTQQEIADYLFIHVTTCNKMFARLKRENLVQKSRKGITVNDYEKLKDNLLLLIDV